MSKVVDVDTNTLERFLLSQEGVLDASAWISRGTVLASVTLMDFASYGEEELIDECRTALGPDQAPQMILFRRALRPAA
ncbi:MAG: hypothetical protein KIT11_06180 [Fimbriimonadaceae bacterium]|nr:hypothetical protein [Fimbriimonadaceae bacterium]QYK55945.1 MAG: hypothetical protein KF733_00370 [Fimbriimonadaceae bacterium]